MVFGQRTRLPQGRGEAHTTQCPQRAHREGIEPWGDDTNPAMGSYRGVRMLGLNGTNPAMDNLKTGSYVL